MLFLCFNSNNPFPFRVLLFGLLEIINMINIPRQSHGKRVQTAACDLKTGQVTELDLSFSMLYGTPHSNNSLFSLHHLQKLVLSYNDFNFSNISSQFGQFSNLMHLNLTHSGFAGQVPLEIFHLSKLVSLDISNKHLSLETISFDKIVQNLTKLRVLT